MKEGTRAEWSGVGRTGTGSGGRGGQPQSGYISAASSVILPGRPADTGPVTASSGLRGAVRHRLSSLAHPQRRCVEQMHAPTPRRQSKAEAAISDEMMAFQHGFVGRGPERIRSGWSKIW